MHDTDDEQVLPFSLPWALCRHIRSILDADINDSLHCSGIQFLFSRHRPAHVCGMPKADTGSTLRKIQVWHQWGFL